MAVNETEAAKPALGEEAISMIAGRFKALSDPSRIRLLGLLMQGEMSVHEMVDASGMSQTNVSRHLGLLRREGIVARRRDGKLAVYRIVDPNIETLCKLVCGGIESQLEETLDALQGGGI